MDEEVPSPNCDEPLQLVLGRKMTYMDNEGYENALNTLNLCTHALIQIEATPPLTKVVVSRISNSETIYTLDKSTPCKIQLCPIAPPWNVKENLESIKITKYKRTYQSTKSSMKTISAWINYSGSFTTSRRYSYTTTDITTTSPSSKWPANKSRFTIRIFKDVSWSSTKVGSNTMPYTSPLK